MLLYCGCSSVKPFRVVAQFLHCDLRKILNRIRAGLPSGLSKPLATSSGTRRAGRRLMLRNLSRCRNSSFRLAL
jgi:hypothetical protein